MTAAAIPWLLLATALAVLIAAMVGLLLDRRELRNADAEIDQLTADNANLTRNWQMLADDLARARNDLAKAHRDRAQMRGERDLARDTVRELLDAQRAGYRYPRPQPMPSGVDNALTEEFTKIVERNIWPEAPSS